MLLHTSLMIFKNKNWMHKFTFILDIVFKLYIQALVGETRPGTLAGTHQHPQPSDPGDQCIWGYASYLHL